MFSTQIFSFHLMLLLFEKFLISHKKFIFQYCPWAEVKAARGSINSMTRRKIKYCWLCGQLSLFSLTPAKARFLPSLQKQSEIMNGKTECISNLFIEIKEIYDLLRITENLINSFSPQHCGTSMTQGKKTPKEQTMRGEITQY